MPSPNLLCNLISHNVSTLNVFHSSVVPALPSVKGMASPKSGEMRTPENTVARVTLTLHIDEGTMSRKWLASEHSKNWHIPAQALLIKHKVTLTDIVKRMLLRFLPNEPNLSTDTAMHIPDNPATRINEYGKNLDGVSSPINANNPPQTVATAVHLAHCR